MGRLPPYTVQVTPTGPLSVPAGFSQTLTATATYPAFAIGTGFNGAVNALALQPDGKLVVGAYAAYLIGFRGGFVQRLDTQGNVEFTYSPSTNTQTGNAVVAVQPDGRILVGSSGFLGAGVVTYLYRLTAAGSLEGALGGYNGVSQSRLARLTADGSLSTTPATGASYVWSTGATGPSSTVNTWGYYSVTAALNSQSAISSLVLIRLAANSLTVYAANEDIAPSTPAIQVQLQVRKEGPTAISYQDLTVRYWFSADGAPVQELPVTYTKLGAFNFTVQTGQQNGQR